MESVINSLPECELHKGQHLWLFPLTHPYYLEHAWHTEASKYYCVNASAWTLLKKDVVWKDWCWSWNSNTLTTWCEELTHWKRPWFWERLKAGGEGDDRGWDGWMASPTWWTWIWAASRSWWWTGKPGVLQSMGSQRIRHDWVTELNWKDVKTIEKIS